VRVCLSSRPGRGHRSGEDHVGTGGLLLLGSPAQEQAYAGGGVAHGAVRASSTAASARATVRSRCRRTAVTAVAGRQSTARPVTAMAPTASTGDARDGQAAGDRRSARRPVPPGRRRQGSGCRGRPSTRGALAVGRLPRQVSVISRATASSPRPSTPLDREDHPGRAQLGVRPHSVLCPRASTRPARAYTLPLYTASTANRMSVRRSLARSTLRSAVTVPRKTASACRAARVGRDRASTRRRRPAGGCWPRRSDPARRPPLGPAYEVRADSSGQFRWRRGGKQDHVDRRGA
jgi:hypothetical protein